MKEKIILYVCNIRYKGPLVFKIRNICTRGIVLRVLAYF